DTRRGPHRIPYFGRFVPATCTEGSSQGRLPGSVNGAAAISRPNRAGPFRRDAPTRRIVAKNELSTAGRWMLKSPSSAEFEEVGSLHLFPPAEEAALPVVLRPEPAAAQLRRGCWHRVKLRASPQ